MFNSVSAPFLPLSYAWWEAGMLCNFRAGMGVETGLELAICGILCSV